MHKSGPLRPCALSGPTSTPPAQPSHGLALPWLQDILYTLVSVIFISGTAQSHPLRHQQEISREHALKIAAIMTRELPTIYANMLNGIGLEGFNQNSICLPDTIRHQQDWNRNSSVAGIRFCLYKKCLDNLQKRGLNQGRMSLNNTSQGLRNLYETIFKMEGQHKSCGEPEIPDSSFWTSEVVGGAYVVRDLMIDLDYLLHQLDSLSLVQSTHS
ncbi:uncharacterized protein LOC132207396 [Stegostoma tigrinum]|uniref:uncharacterized protein LOC132207396 n=1 Tax=Stegostoma tigrinum TaxID=3053191 RepID=UPI0028706CD8|nr:uncharacterized protein LOC132207396 [Stegostoma tigrinum]